MTTEYQLTAGLRTALGRGASRRLRKTNEIPGIVYGSKQAAQAITLSHKEIQKALSKEGFQSHIITLDVAGKKQQVILKDVQRHPVKAKIIHVDFFRISVKQAITVNVPLHYLNEDKAPGVKIGGGMVSKLMVDVEIKCLPKDLPEFIEVDLSDLEVGQSLHLSEIKLPNNVELTSISAEDAGGDHDLPIVSITALRASLEEEEEATTSEEESTNTEAKPTDKNKTSN